MSTRPFLVLVPGILSTDILWKRQVEILSEVADVHVTQQHLRHDSLEAMAEGILAETPPEFAIAGCSMGGYVALLVKKLGGARVTHLCLIDSTANFNLEDGQQSQVQIELISGQENFDGIKRSMIQMFLNEDNQRSMSMNAVVDAMAEAVGEERFLMQLMAIKEGADLRGELRQVTCPTLVLCGAEDKLFPADLSREVSQGVRRSKLVVIDGAAHLLPLERPETVAELMRNWLMGDLHMDRKEMVLK